MMDKVGVSLILGYGVLVLTIGAYHARGQSSTDSYYLADRNLGLVGISGSLFATFLGTGLLFTFASFGYHRGVGSFALVGAAATGLFLLGVAAPRINRLSDRQRAVTLPELLDDHWSERTKAAAAVVTIGLFTGTLAANMYIVGEISRAFLNVQSGVAIAGFGVLVIVYTSLGGFRTVVWSDIAQLALIVLAFGFVLPGAIVSGGTVELSSLPAGHLDPATFPLPVVIAYLLIGVFAFFGSQDLFQRIFAAKTPTEARRGVFVFTGLLVVVGSAAVGLGMVARVVVVDSAPNQALYQLSEMLVPTGLVGLVFLGFIGLANSDADSQVLTVVSSVTQDLLPYLGTGSYHQGLLVDRIAVVGIGSIALLLAIAVPDVAALIGAVGSWFAILGFVVICTLYWGRTTDAGAFAGLTVGFVVPPLVALLIGEMQIATFAGIAAAAILLMIVSLFTRDRPASQGRGDRSIKPTQ